MAFTAYGERCGEIAVAAVTLYRGSGFISHPVEQFRTETHVTSVLDSAGSMAAIRDATISGFNAFLEDQQDAKRTTTVSFFGFDSTVNQTYRGTAIEGAPELSHETCPAAGPYSTTPSRLLS